MQTRILKVLRQTSDGQVADEILRKCVHCGFCNYTCPTYLLSGDENEGPRGRIYLIKQLMEGQLDNTPDSVKKRWSTLIIVCYAVRVKPLAHPV